MTNRRIKLLNKLIGKTTGEDEAKLYKLTIERICIDMCDYYYKFYHNDGLERWFMYLIMRMKRSQCSI